MPVAPGEPSLEGRSSPYMHPMDAGVGDADFFDEAVGTSTTAIA